MDNPPEGLTSTDIRHMSEEDLLDMDYFQMMTILMKNLVREGFIFLIPRSSVVLPAYRRVLIQKSAGGGLSYKVKECAVAQNAETHLFGPVPAFLSFILYYFVFYTILFIFVHL